ncbi:unnamed protein product, partial [Amoebophrya sp. A25]|eukprot:GSA25T00010126001.1
MSRTMFRGARLVLAAFAVSHASKAPGALFVSAATPFPASGAGSQSSGSQDPQRTWSAFIPSCLEFLCGREKLCIRPREIFAKEGANGAASMKAVGASSSHDQPKNRSFFLFVVDGKKNGSGKQTQYLTREKNLVSFTNETTLAEDLKNSGIVKGSSVAVFVANDNIEADARNFEIKFETLGEAKRVGEETLRNRLGSAVLYELEDDDTKHYKVFHQIEEAFRVFYLGPDEDASSLLPEILRMLGQPGPGEPNGETAVLFRIHGQLGDHVGKGKSKAQMTKLQERYLTGGWLPSSSESLSKKCLSDVGSGTNKPTLVAMFIPNVGDGLTGTACSDWELSMEMSVMPMPEQIHDDARSDELSQILGAKLMRNRENEIVTATKVQQGAG